MANARIYLLSNDNQTLQQMPETGYVKEANLQELLAAYPDLLPGDQIDEENPRRWLLVAREMGVPSEADASNRWSLDHLFLDQDGMPTFVECKRATNTEVKRQVVAQMLDYAANGLEYWGPDRLRQTAAQTYGDKLDEKLRELLQLEAADDGAIEEFWRCVETNLRAGHVRLLFVADELPRELRRLIEFLNENMPKVEVLGVEIKQFVGKEQKALVPRVIGATETARVNRGVPATRNRTNQADLLAKCAPDVAAFFEYMVKQAIVLKYRVYWGEVGFSIGAPLPNQQFPGGQFAGFAYGYPKYGTWPSERFEFYFAQLPLSKAQAAELREALLKLGVFTEAGEKTLRVFLNADTLPRMCGVYDFILQQVKAIQAADIPILEPEDSDEAGS